MRLAGDHSADCEVVSTAAGTIDGRRLDWLLVDFVRGTAGTCHALVNRQDGLAAGRVPGP